MSKRDKNSLIRIIDSKLKLEGFQKKLSTWYLEQHDTIKVINLQKSNFSNTYYVNLCIYLKALGEEKYPKEHQCHIRTRINNKIVRIDEEYDHLFDLDNSKLEEEEYKNKIVECIERNILPQLDAINTKEGLLRIAEINPVILNMIPIKVKTYLGI